MVLKKITTAKGLEKKLFAVLIDPDKCSGKRLRELCSHANEAHVDMFFAGSSILAGNGMSHCLQEVKEHSDIPVVLFPGSALQISNKADAVLLLSLISGRNAEMLIGKHVTASPLLKESGLEIIPTGYMLIDGGNHSAAAYMSNTSPIPYNKDDIALCTALAGEMLGLKLIYMDGGSGAKRTVNATMIKKVSVNITIPLIIGGGISSAGAAKNCCKAGADIIVVGNAIEQNVSLIGPIADAVHSS